MSRQRNIPLPTRAVTRVLGLLMLSLILSTVSQAARVSDRVVFPTGAWPTDVDNVQAAVKHGGTVLLKAVNAGGIPTPFNFGPAIAGSGAVSLTSDVTITGETSAGQMTTIQGGDFPFRSYKRIRVAMRGLYFDGPRATAVYIRATTGFEFSGSHVARVVPFLFYTDPEGEVYKGQGIWVVPTRSHSLSGTIVIENNVFEDCGLGGQIGYGLAIVPAGAQVRIAHNVIRGANLAGMTVFAHGDQVVVEHNTIAPGPGDSQRVAHGNGIHVLGTFADGSLVIRHNEISVEGPEAHGIFMFGDAVFNGPLYKTLIEDNRITVDRAWAGIGLRGQVSQSYVSQNTIRGTADFAVMVREGFYDPAEQAIANVFVGNNITAIEAAVADVFFDTNTLNNVWVGYSGKVIDLGTGNHITGTPISPPQSPGRQPRSMPGVLPYLLGVLEPDDMLAP